MGNIYIEREGVEHTYKRKRGRWSYMIGIREIRLKREREIRHTYDIIDTSHRWCGESCERYLYGKMKRDSWERAGMGF